MATVYIAFGSNLGNRKKNIAAALDLLAKNDITILDRSTIIETNPIDCPEKSRKFLNGVIKVATPLAPHRLLRQLNAIETQLGRTSKNTNDPRTIDLDILLYDKLILQTPELTIPHPRMLQREFVLKPLKEIAPELIEDLHANC